MLLSACMIVKNEGEMLKKTLPLLVKNMDEVIVVDTGSVDDTVEVAKELGARVEHFQWIKDFSAARNESLKYAKGEWIIWIDADETLKEEDILRLKEELKNSKETAYCVTMGECALDAFDVLTSYERVKIFKNGLDIHFERPINEQVYDKEGKILLGRKFDLTIYHWGGHLKAEKMKQKKERNVAMFTEMLAKNPEDCYARLLIGQSLAVLERYEEALEHFTKGLELKPRDKWLFLKLLEQKINALYKLNRGKESFALALELRKIDPENVKAHNILGAVLLSDGEKLDLAETILKSIESFKGVCAEAHEKNYINKMFLGDVLKKKGDLAGAVASYRRAQAFSDSEEIQKRIEETNNGI